MNNELDFIDVLSILSFWISLQNLKINISQQDMDNQTTELTERLEKAINDIHEHLSVQDTKINALLNRLEDLNGNT